MHLLCGSFPHSWCPFTENFEQAHHEPVARQPAQQDVVPLSCERSWSHVRDHGLAVVERCTNEFCVPPDPCSGDSICLPEHGNRFLSQAVSGVITVYPSKLEKLLRCLFLVAGEICNSHRHADRAAPGGRYGFILAANAADCLGIIELKNRPNGHTRPGVYGKAMLSQASIDYDNQNAQYGN